VLEYWGGGEWVLGEYYEVGECMGIVGLVC
jgi:hypothetical protein